MIKEFAPGATDRGLWLDSHLNKSIHILQSRRTRSEGEGAEALKVPRDGQFD